MGNSSRVVDAGGPGKRPSSFLWLLVLLIVAVIGWSGFWLFAARQTGEVLQAWMAREKAFGRVWSCPQPKIGGYPFAITVACAAPHFEGLILGHTYSGTMQGLRASAVVSHPRDVELSFASPFAGTSKDGDVDFRLAWKTLDVRLEGLPQGLWQLAANGQGFDLSGKAGTASFGSKVSAAAVTASQRGAQDGQVVDFDVALRGASIPEVDQVLGPGAPSDIAAQGTVTQAGVDVHLTPAQNLDRWRLAGGHVDLANFALTRDATQFTAHGTFSFNAAHRVQGHFDTKSSGLEPVLKNYGIDPSLLNFGALLGNLLSGNSNRSQSDQPAALRLLINIDDGRLAVGPIRTDIRLPAAY